MLHRELTVLLSQALDTQVAVEDTYDEDGVLRINIAGPDNRGPLVVELCRYPGGNRYEASYHRVAFVGADAAVACRNAEVA